MQRTRSQGFSAAGFLAPNLLGFALFTAAPLSMSVYMALTNWDLRLHHQYVGEPVRFVGLANFSTLLTEPDFWRYLWNTLFLMAGLPFGIVGSLAAALLLHQDPRTRSRRLAAILMAAILLLAGVASLLVAGAGSTGLILLIGGVAGLVMMGGLTGGAAVYRTIFYPPHFTAGVATYLLWKKLYAPTTGPINQLLRPALDQIHSIAIAVGPVRVIGAAWAIAVIGMAVGVFGARRLAFGLQSGEVSRIAGVSSYAVLFLPVLIWLYGQSTYGVGWAWIVLLVVATVTARRPQGAGSFIPHWRELWGTVTARSMFFAIAQAGLIGLHLAVCRSATASSSN